MEAMGIREVCPACGAQRYKNNGHTRHGTQNHHCKACARQCGATAEDHCIAEAQHTMIERLLRERISLRGMCRAVGVRLPWLWHFMVPCCAACPDALHVQVPARPTDVGLRRLEAEADARWGFGKKKAKKPWIGSAMEATTRQIMALHVSDRSRESAKALWAQSPLVYREQATLHTDHYDASTGVLPAEQQKAITQHARNAQHIERFQNTWRQRVSHLVHETLSCSKKLTHHLGAIKYFIGHYNLTRTTAAALPVEHYRLTFPHR